MKRYVWFLVAAAAVTLLLSIAGRVGLFGTGTAPETASTTTGTAAIGGPFELVDQNGERVTDKDFRGQHALVFFGFTSCPDICPTTLQQITLTLDELGERAQKLVPVFITLDPERDDPAKLAEYLDHFHPRLVGLTGTEEEIAAAADAYRVYHAKVEMPDSALGYTIDHSAFIYLMGPEGDYITHFTHNDSPSAMADKLRQVLPG